MLFWLLLEEIFGPLKILLFTFLFINLFEYNTIRQNFILLTKIKFEL
jgi:hypothetical protein